ncbi:uncharacterized protein LOC134449128 [Engraulis encrasicolus]|uniref:uncharacterized protein LOC134449128 n=1 Tax=Engraulis encrasicolus TaxID=184585 RepID=UPI002FD16C41
MKLVLLVCTLAFAGVTLGMDCVPFARPWMVHFSNGRTGVLINEWWVLTQLFYRDTTEGVSARLGVDELTGNSDGEQQIAVDMWIHHDPYGGYRRRRKRIPIYSLDLCLVRLAVPARLTPQVQPAPLPTQCAQAGELCVATSFASTAGKQQCLVQKVLSDSVCQRHFPWYWTPTGLDMICMSSHPSSGGQCPIDERILMCGGILQGVFDFRWVKLSVGCTYVKICRYRRWIDTVMSHVTTPPPRSSPEPPNSLVTLGATLGMDCRPFARPWMVRFSSGQTGVLINEWWVLTQGAYGVSPAGASARLGVDDLTGNSDGEQQIDVDMWINHDPYSGHRRRKRSPIHDLAIVKLAQPARLTPQVQPAPLPTQCAQAGELCVATSFASTNGSQKQQCLVQPMLSESTCRQLNPMFWSPYMTCAGSHPSPGGHCMTGRSILVCGGILQGVGGFGWMSEGCSHGKPDTYAKICAYRRWIDSILDSMTPTLPPTTTPPTTVSPTTQWWDGPYYVS